MNVQLCRKSFVSWGQWVGLPIEQAFKVHSGEPVMVETMEEADYLRGYGLMIGMEFHDLSVMSPIRPNQGIYMSAAGYEIKLWIKVKLS